MATFKNVSLLPAVAPQHIGQQMNFTALQARPTSSASQKSVAGIGSQVTNDIFLIHSHQIHLVWVDHVHS